MTELLGSSDGDHTETESTTQQGRASTLSGQQSGKELPGRRLYNPLASFASYTYNISLYMITPEAYDAFVQSGRRNIYALAGAGGDNNQGAGVYLIAQSGGINNETDLRSPGFEYDFYIDNLKITSHTCAKASGGATNTSEISFNVYEPYGFSFVTNLKTAQDSLQAYMQQTGRSQKNLENPTRQFFILGIRFTGYDINGNILIGDKGKFLDPTANENGVFETFYDIAITELKFKLTGKMVTYSVKTQSLPSKEAFGTKRGLVDVGATIEAGSVYDALKGPKGLLAKINAEQELAKSSGKIGIPDKYDIVFLSDMEERVKGATIVSPSDLDKYKWGSSGAKRTSDSNDATATNVSPNNNVRTVSIQGATPIIQAINQIMSQSSYLEDALKVVYTTSLQPNPAKKSEDETVSDSKANVSWYNISAQVSKAEWDSVRSDFALNITYMMVPYDTPIIQNAYSNPGIKYYGPHKRYSYWYTGENSEIINYEQTLDTAYYNVAMVPSTAGSEAKGGPAAIPLKPNQRTNMPRTGRTDIGAEAQNSYLTSLYDPKAWATAKITILGDPDYLIQDAESIDGVGAVYNKFYGTNGYTIKANGGQVFIEIDFVEAVDYEHNTGVLSLNESILFWAYPESISKLVKGVSYQVVTVDSSFSNGKFTQVLTCTINTFGDVGGEAGAGRQTNTGPNESNSSTTNNTGLLRNNNPSTNNNVSSNTPRTDVNQSTTNTGVADDDG